MYYPPCAASSITDQLVGEDRPFERWPPGLAAIIAAYAECNVTLSPHPTMNGYNAECSRSRDYVCDLSGNILTVRNGGATYTVAIPNDNYMITLDTADTLWLTYLGDLIMYIPYGTKECLALRNAHGKPVFLYLPSIPPGPIVCSMNVLSILPPDETKLPTLIFNVDDNLYSGPAGGEYTYLSSIPTLTNQDGAKIIGEHVYISTSERQLLTYTLQGVQVGSLTNEQVYHGLHLDHHGNLLRSHIIHSSVPYTTILCTTPQGITRPIYTHTGFLMIVGVMYDGSILVMTKNKTKHDIFFRLHFE